VRIGSSDVVVRIGSSDVVVRNVFSDVVVVRTDVLVGITMEGLEVVIICVVVNAGGKLEIFEGISVVVRGGGSKGF
jgi:hypothetical protein